MSYNDQESGATTGAPIELYRFVIGSKVYTYTSGDQDQVYSSETYTAEPLLRGAIELDGESTEGSVEITLPRTNPVAAYFVPYTPEPPMTVTIYRRHRSDPEVIGSRWSVSSATFSDGVVRLSCLPASEVFRRAVPRNVFSSQCNWALYSSQCGVSPGAFKVVATVSAIADDTIQAGAFSAFADGWFNNGYVERADGTRRWIVQHVGPTLTLMSAWPDLAVNENLTAFPGCDRTEATCAGKFSNLPNHFGFGRIPTKNPFTGGLV